MLKTANLIASVSRNAGGLYESVRNLVQSLAAGGMDVRVIGARDEFTEADKAAWQPVELRVFNPTWPAKFCYSKKFVRELTDYRPDIMHSHGLWLYPSIAASSYCRKSRTPCIISAHGMLDPWAIRNSHWKKVIAYFFYEGSHLRGARCLRALCESEARAMREINLKNEIAIIPNGIGLPESREQKVESRNPPWHGVVEPGRKVLLYLGRIHPKKGLSNLLKAWRQIQRSEAGGQRPEWVLAIAGWDQGGHESELKQLATELGLEWTDIREQKTESRKQKSPVGQESAEEITESTKQFQLSAFPISAFSLVFLGPQFGDAKTACYQSCDGFILPSFSEGVPMVVLEAWARSKPVIMTPQCNLLQGFTAGAAMRVDPNPESLTQGVNGFLRMTETQRTTMGSRGRALVADRFAWPKIGAQTKEVYKWMLGAGPKPDCMAEF